MGIFTTMSIAAGWSTPGVDGLRFFSRGASLPYERTTPLRPGPILTRLADYRGV
jgi:hypothetical protein